MPANSYRDTWAELNRIFAKGTLCRPVDMQEAHSGTEVLNIYSKYVNQEDSEGLVVHTPVGMIFKVKPRHNIDVVVIAYGEGSGIEAGQVRTMLTAFIPENGKFQVMTRVGSGLNHDLRVKLFRYFSDKITNNPFYGMNIKYADMVFIRPKLVIEISIGDIVTELTSGEKTNYLLKLDKNEYSIDSQIPGFKFYAPVFIQLRTDKEPDEYDVNPNQLSKYLKPLASRNELLLQDIYCNLNGKVIKYIIYKTSSGVYKYLRLNTRPSRFLFTDSSSMDIITIYEADINEAVRNGFIRDKDKLITTDKFFYELKTAD